MEEANKESMRMTMIKERKDERKKDEKKIST
jgi:hypothetical protein